VLSSADDVLHYKFNNAMLYAYSHVCVSSCSIPKTYYTLPVDADLIVYESDGTKTLTFSAGNYSLSSFKTILRSKLTALTEDYTVSSSNINTEADDGKLRLTCTDDIDIYTEDAYLAAMLGVADHTLVSFVGGILVSSKVVRYQSHDSLYFKSNLVVNQRQLLNEIFVSDTPYFSTITYRNQDILLYGKEIHKISNAYDFSLVDVYDRAVGLNGSSWTLVLCFYNYDEEIRKITSGINNLQTVIKSFLRYTLERNDSKDAERLQNNKTTTETYATSPGAPANTSRNSNGSGSSVTREGEEPGGIVN